MLKAIILSISLYIEFKNNFNMIATTNLIKKLLWRLGTIKTCSILIKLHAIVEEKKEISHCRRLGIYRQMVH